MATEELRAVDVGECLGRRAPHHYYTAFVPQKNGCCSEMGNLRRAANNHQHTVLTDARVASVAASQDLPIRTELLGLRPRRNVPASNIHSCRSKICGPVFFRLVPPQKTMKPPSPKEPQDGLGH